MINLMYEHCGRGADRIDACCMIWKGSIQIQVTIVGGQIDTATNAAIVSE